MTRIALMMLIPAPILAQASITYIQQGKGPKSGYRIVVRNLDAMRPAQISGAVIEEQAALNGIEPLQVDLQTPWTIARETAAEIGRIGGPSGTAAAFIAKGPPWAKVASLAVTAIAIFLPRLLRNDTPYVDPAAPPIAIAAGGGAVRQMRGYSAGGKIAPVHVTLDSSGNRIEEIPRIIVLPALPSHPSESEPFEVPRTLTWREVLTFGVREDSHATL